MQSPLILFSNSLNAKKEIGNKCTKIILDAKGGGGHVRAADSKESYLKSQGCSILRYSVLQDDDSEKSSWMKLFCYDMGKKITRDWRKKQNKGEMGLYTSLTAVQTLLYLNHHVFGHEVRGKLKNKLLKHPDVNEIVDTEYLFAKDFAREVHQLNKKRDKKVKYTLVLTDLPADIENMLYPLSMIDKKDLSSFYLEAPHAPPLTGKDSQQTVQYFKKQCPFLFDNDKILSLNTLSDSQRAEYNRTYYRKQYRNLRQLADDHFEFTYGPIRQPFIEIASGYSSFTKASPLNIQFKTNEGQKLFELTTGIKVKDNATTIEMPNFSLVSSIMLGSNAATQATLDYIKEQVTDYNMQLKENQNMPERYLYVFTGNCKKDSLFEKVCDLINQYKKKNILPEQFKIIPLEHQEADVIAQLYSVADECLIRSGGLSCMEVKAVCGGRVFIHSEYQGTKFTKENLFKPMLPWEIGNAKHVQAVLGKHRVQFVTPKSYKGLTKEINYPCRSLKDCMKYRKFRCA